MSFCPECGAEYKAGIFRCGECGVALAEELPQPEPTEPLELIKKCGPTEAAMMEEMLANNGIGTVLQGGVTPVLPTRTNLDEVRIWVKQADAGRARELIEAFFEEEESEGDVGESEESRER